jgi:hypothetical protein
MATTMAAVPDTPKPMGAGARLIGALVSPRATFEDIARRPGWLAPLIVLTLLSIALTSIMGQRVNWMEVGQRQIAKSHLASSQIQSLPPDKQQQAFERQAMAAKIGNYVVGVAGTTLLALVLSGLYLGLFKVSGSNVNFLTSFSVVSYGLMPMGVKALLGIPVVLMKDPSAIDPQNFVASNLGALLPSSAPLWQITLGNSVDLFVVWSMIIMAIGFSVVDPKKVSFGKAFSIILGVFVFFTLVFTGIALL